MSSIDDLIQGCLSKIQQQTPSTNIAPFTQDIKHNMQALLKEGLKQLDLISREEFDAQTRVLARTQQKITHLEKQLTALEATIRSERDDL